MQQGTVKWFNRQKGFGFIASSEGSSDIFIHISELEKIGVNDLQEGQKISYEVVSNRGKSSAANIQLD